MQHLLGSVVQNDKEIGEYEFQSVGDILYVDLFHVKVGQRWVGVPQVVSKDIRTTSIKTYEGYKNAFQSKYGKEQFVQLDSGLLVNTGNIKEIYKSPSTGQYVADFGDGYNVEIAKNKKNMPLIKDFTD